MTGGVVLAVALETPMHSAVGGLLDYAADAPLTAGTLVRVPLGRREVTGLVWGAGSVQAVPGLRPIAQALTALPPLSDDWRALIDFAAAYYQRGTGELALAVLPPELRKVDATQLARRLKRLPPVTAPTAAAVSAAPADRPPLAAEQAEALAVVRSAMQPSPAWPLLLHGVTGSGKTEVYLRAAEDALARGGQVLVMVPEINLTPQLEARFAERFPGRVLASLHSALTPAQRLRNWLLAHLGQADLVLGTRLAVFASLPTAGADRGRRGTRPVVQAAGRRALFGARPGSLARPPPGDTGDPGIGHAVAGKLAAGRWRVAIARCRCRVGSVVV